MPPLPTWFRGREAIATFLTTRTFRSTWRFEVTSAAGQPAMAGRRLNPETGRYEPAARSVVTFEGELVAAITSFLGPGVLGRFGPGEVLRPTDDFAR